MIPWFDTFPYGMTVRMLLQYMKNWESTGFIASDVWSNIDYIIDFHTIKSAVSVPTMTDKKDDILSSEDRSDDRLLSCVARYIIDSRALFFAVDKLALPAHIYKSIERDTRDDKHLMKFKVCYVKIGTYCKALNTPSVKVKRIVKQLM